MKILYHFTFAFLFLTTLCGIAFLIVRISDRNRDTRLKKEAEYEEYATTAFFSDEVNLGKLLQFEVIYSTSGYRNRDIVKNYRVVAEKGTVLEPTWCPSFAPTPCNVMYSSSINRIRFVPVN